MNVTKSEFVFSRAICSHVVNVACQLAHLFLQVLTKTLEFSRTHLRSQNHYIHDPELTSRCSPLFVSTPLNVMRPPKTTYDVVAYIFELWLALS